MAFLSKVGNLLKQAASSPISSELRVSKPSIFQAIRYLSSFTSSKLFIGGLSYGTDEQSLTEAFSKYGEVIEARIIMDRETGRSRGFGFVTYTSSEEASSAIQALDGTDLHGRRVKVNYATDRARPNPGFGYGAPGGYSGGYGGGQGGYGGGQGGYGAPQSGFGSGQGNYGAPQGGYGSSQGGYGAGGGSSGGGYNAGEGFGGGGASNYGGNDSYASGENSNNFGANGYASSGNVGGYDIGTATNAGIGIGRDTYVSDSAVAGGNVNSGFEGNPSFGYNGGNQFAGNDNSNIAGNSGGFGQDETLGGNYRNDEGAEFAKRA